MQEFLVVSRNVKGRRETIGQTVVGLVPVDQPQRHSLLVRVEIENPSLVQFHKAPPRSAKLSPRRRAVFPGRGRWKEGWPPSDCRGTGRWRPAYTYARERTAGRNAAGPPRVERV